jgi:hypothetical protein
MHLRHFNTPHAVATRRGVMVAPMGSLIGLMAWLSRM